MNAIELRAYEVLGHWTIVLIWVHSEDGEQVRRDSLYVGEHGPIDDTDPTEIATQLLSTVSLDLAWEPERT